MTYNAFSSKIQSGSFVIQSGSFVITLIFYLPIQGFRGRESLCSIAEGCDRGYEE